MFFILTGVTEIYAQADISMSTHWYNRASYNPASIVRPDYMYFFLNARKQWAGLNGSPNVLNLQASDYSERLRSGFGVSIINDEVGLTHVVNPSLLYAFCVPLKEHLFISMGLLAGAFIRTLNGARFEAETILDPFLGYVNTTQAKPDANLGFEMQGKYFILGASLTHLFSISRPDELFMFSNHRYGYVYYRNSDSPVFSLTLGCQVVNRNSLTVLEGHSMIRFKSPTGLRSGSRELFDAGVTYRSSGQMTMLFGINFSSDLRVGYAYDYDFNFTKEKKSSMEFFVEYRIPFVDRSSCPGGDWYF